MFGNGSNERKIEKGKVVMESTENEEGIGKKNGGKERPHKKKNLKKTLLEKYHPDCGHRQG